MSLWYLLPLLPMKIFITQLLIYLSIFYANHGLNTKLQQLYVAGLASDYNIICLTETWLKPSVSNSEILGPNFNIFRKDHTTSSSYGCGVLIAVRVSLPVEAIAIPDHLEIT